MSKITVHHGDSREVLKSISDCSIDACVCDPPYALVSISKRFGKEGAAPATGNDAYMRASAGFMGKKWDTGETAFDPVFWVEVLRVMKPGAHLIAFSGTRTYHRLACAIEDAGFEIRDMVAWIYGSGFPKSHDVAKSIDRTELNVIRGRAGRQGASFGQEYERTPKGEPISENAKIWDGWGTALKPALEPIVLARKPLAESSIARNVLAYGTGALNIDDCRTADREQRTLNKNTSINFGGSGAQDAVIDGNLGRWPANVIHDGSERVVEAFPDTNSGGGPAAGTPRTRGDVYGEPNVSQTAPRGQNDGSAARFFYSAKADAEDRLGSKHPTVKPVDLMAYLCRLITQPGGLVLDPFAGSGSTGIAAMGQGFDAILIEREAEYVADIHRRIAWVRGEGRLTAQEIAKPVDALGDLPLFSQPASHADSEREGESTARSRTKVHRADGVEVVTP